jgi:tRNA pseudouridine55 synthase
MTVQGILNVDKPEGITSFRVVSLVRRLSGVRKVGHAGTLDSLATGVLLVCLGHAVRMSEYLMELPKTYRGTVRLGVATDTFDADGEPVFEGDAGSVDETAIRAALAALAEQEEQTPPAYSALKVGGTPAHRLARAGSRQPAPPPDQHRTHRPALVPAPLVEIEVRCGRGRTPHVADDLGGAWAAAAPRALRRTAGPFDVDEAVSWSGWRRLRRGRLAEPAAAGLRLGTSRPSTWRWRRRRTSATAAPCRASRPRSSACKGRKTGSAAALTGKTAPSWAYSATMAGRGSGGRKKYSYLHVRAYRGGQCSYSSLIRGVIPLTPP